MFEIDLFNLAFSAIVDRCRHTLVEITFVMQIRYESFMTMEPNWSEAVCAIYGFISRYYSAELFKPQNQRCSPYCHWTVLISNLMAIQYRGF